MTSLSMLEKNLRNEIFCRNEKSMVLACYELAERYPISEQQVRRLLQQTPHRLSYEVQFSLINALDTTSYPCKLSLRLTKLIEAFLMSVPSNAGKRAFICGCFLGWTYADLKPTGLSNNVIDTIDRVAKGAKFAAGRYGALHAIDHAVGKCDVKDGKKFLEIVAFVHRHDRAYSLRSQAALFLSADSLDLRKKPKPLRDYAAKLGGKNPWKAAKKRSALPLP